MSRRELRPSPAPGGPAAERTGSERRARRRLLGLMVAGSAAAGAAVWAVWPERTGALGPVVDLAAFGYDPDDVSPAIASIIQRLPDGGTIRLPPGDIVTADAVQLDRAGITLTGAGVLATRLIADETLELPVIRVAASGCGVDRLTVDGSSDGSGERQSSHGIVVAENARSVSLTDLRIIDTGGYGIGFQGRGGAGGALFSDALVENVTIIDAGDDGIDAKSAGPVGVECDPETGSAVTAACRGAGSRFRNVTVIDHNANPGASGDTKRAVDVRGRVQMENIEVLGLSDGAIGIVLRPPSRVEADGIGATGSTLENWYVEVGAGAGSAFYPDDAIGSGSSAVVSDLSVGPGGIVPGER